MLSLFPARSPGIIRIFNYRSARLASPAQASWNDARRREARRRFAVEVEVLNREKELIEAKLRGDLTTIADIYADEYVSVSPDSILGGKASELRDLKSGDIKLFSISTDEVAVRVFESTAVVTGQMAVHGRFGGKERTEQWKFMHIFLKRHSRWVLIAQQLTRIARPL